MSLLGPITDYDRRSWQRTGLAVLNRVIEHGTAKRLPPLLWTLSTSSRAHGQVTRYYRGEHDQAAVWQQWFDALRLLCGAPVMDRRTTGRDGTRHYVARFGLHVDPHDGLRGGVTIAADIAPPAPDDTDTTGFAPVTGEEC